MKKIKRAIILLPVIFGAVIFSYESNADIRTAFSNIRTTFSNILSTGKDYVQKNPNNGLVKSIGTLTSTIVSVGTNVAATKINSVTQTITQSQLMQNLINAFSNNVTQLETEINNKNAEINKKEAIIQAQENILTEQIHASGVGTLEQHTQLSNLEAQKQACEIEKAPYTNALAQINLIRESLQTGDLNKLAVEVPNTVKNIETLLLNTPLKAEAERLLVQAGNQVANEAANEINQQNQNLQNYAQQVQAVQPVVQH
jgi:hypothetical protein